MNGSTCPVCGSGKLQELIGEFRTDFVAGNGETREVVVPEVRKFVCQKCGEYILDPDSERKISAAQRQALGLLSSYDLQSFRTKHGMSQEAIAGLLGLGKKTWCRWESDDYFQSEAFDRYLRLLMFAPVNLQALQLIDREKSGRDVELKVTFRYVVNLDALTSLAEQFNLALVNGPFNQKVRTCT